MEKRGYENERIGDTVFSEIEEFSSDRKLKKAAPGEKGTTCWPEQSSCLKSNSEQPVSPSQSVLFETDSAHNSGCLALTLDTLKRESPEQEEGEVSTAGAAAKDHKKVQQEDSLQLLEELMAERDEACRLNRQLQMRLAEYFQSRPIDGGQLERDRPEEELLQEYETSMKILSELKQQLNADSQKAQQQADELRLQSQEKLDKVEEEWEAFMAMKQDVAMTTLSRRLGTELARSKVQSVLAAERLRQDELTKLRLKHFKLRSQIRRLEAELRDGSERGEDPMRIQFEQLQASILERKKQAKKEREESLKLQKKIRSCLEVLSNVKEKLYWSQMDVQAKRQQLAEVEVAVAKTRDRLTQTKLARSNLQRDNQRLKERRGLLGNRDLLRDFEETVDASEQLEKHLENLKLKVQEINFRCGRWRQNLAAP